MFGAAGGIRRSGHMGPLIFGVALLLALLNAPAMANVGQAEDAQTASAPRPEMTASLSLAVILDDQTLGRVTAMVTTREVISLSADGLAQLLKPILSPQYHQALVDLGADSVSAAQIRAIGYGLEFDAGRISLVLMVPPDYRAAQSFSGLRARALGYEVLEPSSFALGVTGSLQTLARFGQDRDPDTQISLSGFANLGGVDGIQIVFGGLADLSGGEGFQRGRMQVFKDDRFRTLRYSFGDLFPTAGSAAGQAELFGISVERNYQALDPTRNVRSTGRRSLFLERRSRVEVLVNGSVVQSFYADPGPVSIRDIPLALTSNEVVLMVEDDLGRREIERFSASADMALIEEGLSEFSLALGVPRARFGSGFDYENEPVLTGSYTRGLSQNLTLTAYGQINREMASMGGGAATVSRFGLLQGQLGLSHSDEGRSGANLGVAWRGNPADTGGREGMFNAYAEYRTRDYERVAQMDLEGGTRAMIGGDYRFSLSRNTALSFGGAYYSRYGASATSSLFATGSRGFVWGTASASLRYLDQKNRGRDVGIMLTLSAPIGAGGYSYSSYDSLTDTARVEYRRRPTLDYPSTEFALAATAREGEREFSGRAGVETSRLSSSLDLVHGQRSDRLGNSENTSALFRLQSGVAFVDGRLGIGRDPGQGFVLVGRHASISKGVVEVSSGAGGRLLGRADGWGPAVIPLYGGYREQELRMNPQNLPMGYNIGSGSYLAVPGAISGISIEVGSDSFRTVLGILIGADGEALSLVTGRAIHAETGESHSFFTNSRGRLALNRLRSGQYRVELDGAAQAFEFTISEADPALVNLGQIQLEDMP